MRSADAEAVFEREPR